MHIYDAAVNKSSSVLVARILAGLIIAALVFSRVFEGWWWIIVAGIAAPFFIGFVSSILMAITGGSDEDDAGADE